MVESRSHTAVCSVPSCNKRYWVKLGVNTCDEHQMTMGGDGNGGRWAFTIPCLPPSVNSLHQIIWTQRKVVLKPEILRWRSDIALFIPRIQLQPDTLVAVDLIFHYNHWYQNGKLKRFDTHNLVKCLLDVIAWKANFDDSRVKSGSWQSVHSVREKVEVNLREYAATASTQAPDS